MSAATRPNLLRLISGAVATGVLVLVAGPAWPGRAEAAGAGRSRSTPTQDGWWNRLQGPAEGEPEANPVRPLVPSLPKPPNVPAEAIVTSAGAGQVDKIAAVGIDLTLADDATLDGLTLRLKEASGGGANVGADTAEVTACPATTPWGPAQNGAWQDRPEADCGLGAAQGSRADDGTWTFDLTAIGRLWAGPAASLGRHGVVLSVDPASSPVQVSWLNLDSGNVAVDLVATPAPVSGAGPAVAEAADPAPAPPPVGGPPASRGPASPGPVSPGPGPSPDRFASAPGPPADPVQPRAGSATADLRDWSAPPAGTGLAAGTAPPRPGPRARRSRLLGRGPGTDGRARPRRPRPRRHRRCGPRAEGPPVTGLRPGGWPQPGPRPELRRR